MRPGLLALGAQQVLKLIEDKDGGVISARKLSCLA
jgi:hypothetical protein